MFRTFTSPLPEENRLDEAVLIIQTYQGIETEVI